MFGLPREDLCLTFFPEFPKKFWKISHFFVKLGNPDSFFFLLCRILLSDILTGGGGLKAGRSRKRGGDTACLLNTCWAVLWWPAIETLISESRKKSIFKNSKFWLALLISSVVNLVIYFRYNLALPRPIIYLTNKFATLLP